MLTQLLRMLADGKVYNSVQLARALDVTQGMITPMLEDLERRGYVQHLRLGCEEGKCKGCAYSKSCSPTTALSGWALTDKGREMATRGA